MTLASLKVAAVAQTLFAPASLARAIGRLGFVQADPIRSPERAQDLILRHRVREYRAGELERRYARLDVEEGVLYAYGFLARRTAELLHPDPIEPQDDLHRRILAIVREHGPLHPNALERWFGRDRIVNDWGGTSLATTHALERLRRHGLVRVSARAAGIRVYEATLPRDAHPLSTAERMRALLAVVAGILGPMPERTLSAIAAKLVRRFPGIRHRDVMREMLSAGDLRRETVDGRAYWSTPRRRPALDRRRVRILAPFDPIVWDRDRFEHLWGWAYRFEAYVPPALRVRGYYAQPLLWGTDVIGWANVRAGRAGASFDFGYASRRPRDRAFTSALEEEVEAMRAFLSPPPGYSNRREG